MSEKQRLNIDELLAAFSEKEAPKAPKAPAQSGAPFNIFEDEFLGPKPVSGAVPPAVPGSAKAAPKSMETPPIQPSLKPKPAVPRPAPKSTETPHIQPSLKPKPAAVPRPAPKSTETPPVQPSLKPKPAAAPTEAAPKREVPKEVPFRSPSTGAAGAESRLRFLGQKLFDDARYYNDDGSARKVFYDEKTREAQYTFCCPNCGTRMISSDCVFDLRDAIEHYLSSGEATETERTDAFRKLFPSERKAEDAQTEERRDAALDGALSSSMVFYEAAWPEIAKRMGSDGVLTLTCRDLIAKLLARTAGKEGCVPGRNRVSFESEGASCLTGGAIDRNDVLGDLLRCADVRGLYARRTGRPAAERTGSYDPTPAEIERMRGYLTYLIEHPDTVVLRAKVELGSSRDVFGCINIESVTLRFIGHDAVTLWERRCPQDVCGKRVSDCHGTAEEIIVGMLGSTGSGKTMFMTALYDYLDTHKRTLRSAGVSCSWSMKDRDGGLGDFIEHNVEMYRGGELPDKTGVGERRYYTLKVDGWAYAWKDTPANPVHISTPDRQDVRVTKLLTIYDLPGELLADDKLKTLTKKADAYWFCITPGQLDPSRERDELDQARKPDNETPAIIPINEVIANAKKVNNLNVPIALILTKADLYRSEGLPKEIWSNERVLEISDMCNIDDAKGMKGFRIRKFRRYENIVRRFAEEGDRKGMEAIAALGASDRYSFFSCAPFGSIESSTANPYGVFLPFLWTLAAKGLLPAVDSRDEEQRDWLGRMRTVAVARDYMNYVYRPQGDTFEKAFFPNKR